MPLLALFFGSLMSGLAAFLAQFVIKKTAIALTALAGIALATGGLMAVLNGIVKPLLGRLFQTAYGQAIGLAFPPVAGECLIAIGVCWSACMVYSWQVKSIGIMVKS